MRTLYWVVVCFCVGIGASVVPVAGQEVSLRQPGYRIGPNDVVRIQVFGEEDLSLETKVEGDGKITYPLLGALPVAGCTIEELQHTLTVRLAAGYVKKPKVLVSIARHRNFYVGGEVRTPGGHPYEEGITVQKAVTLAGGFTDKADKRTVTVTRVSSHGVETLTVGSDDLVKPDDLVAVAQLKKFYINGEVRRAGDYPYERDLTLHQAVTMAGGFTDKAVTSHAKVIRKQQGQERTLSIDLDALVLPDDVLSFRAVFFDSVLIPPANVLSPKPACLPSP